MKKRKPKEQSEKSIQNAIRRTLEATGWLTEKTHGNRYQPGWPDLMCFRADRNPIGGAPYRITLRWLEVKKPSGSLTPRQITRFAKWEAAGLGVWVACSRASLEELFNGPPNWRDWLPTPRPSSPGSRRPSPAKRQPPSGRRAGASR